MNWLPPTAEAAVPLATFLADARRNARIMRSLHGRHSRAYRELLWTYRQVAARYGWQHALERVLHPLRRVPPGPRRMHHWRVRRSADDQRDASA